MNCCHAQKKLKRQRNSWRSTGGSLVPGVLLILLPKCPLCIAAYLTLWMGAGAAMAVAVRLRPAVEVLFVVSAVLLLVRWVVPKLARGATAGERT